MNVPTVNKLALSGGRTSAYMLKLLMDQHGPDFARRFIVTFCNTGKELDPTLDFVHQIESEWGIPVVWLEYTRVPAIEVDPMIYPHKKSQKTVRDQQERGETTHWFKVVNYETARRNGTPNTPFDELLGWANVLPNVRTRICSVQMKVRTMMRYLFSLRVYEWNDYIGIRSDEAHRGTEILANCPKYIRPVFPLISENTTEADVLSFWRNQPFDLQLQSYEGNCDHCYLKSWAKRVRLAKERPEGNAWWEGWEAKFGTKPTITGDGKYFRKGEPYSMVKIHAGMPTFFDFFGGPDVPCGCGDKGFVIAASQDENLEN